MYRKNYLLIIFITIISLSACLEKIDLELDKGLERSLYIEGKLIKGDPFARGYCNKPSLNILFCSREALPRVYYYSASS